jgi:hypothetical protein
MNKNSDSRMPCPPFTLLDLIYVMCRKLTAIFPEFLNPQMIENAQKEMERGMRDEVPPEIDPVDVLLNQMKITINELYGEKNELVAHSERDDELMEICHMAVACAHCGCSDGRKVLTTIINAGGTEEEVLVCEKSCRRVQ